MRCFVWIAGSGIVVGIAVCEIESDAQHFIDMIGIACVHPSILIPQNDKNSHKISPDLVGFLAYLGQN